MSKTYLVTKIKNVKTPVSVIKVTSLEKVDWSNIGTLVYNDSSDEDYNKIRILSNQIKKEGLKIIYINKELSPILLSLFSGCKDLDVYDDESYITDTEVLDYLIEEFGSTQMTVPKADESLIYIQNSILSLREGSENLQRNILSNDTWYKEMENAVVSVMEQIYNSENLSNELVNLVDSVFVQLQEVAKEVEEGTKKTDKEIKDLRIRVSEYETMLQERVQETSRKTGVLEFAEYVVPRTSSSYMYIKEFSKCRYLISSLLAYQDYLRNSKQKDLAILLLLPNQKYVLEKYSRIGTDLSDSSMDMVSYESNLYTTSTPTKRILDAFFSRVKSENYIVVDMIMNERILKGPNLKILNAVGSIGDLKEFSLPSESTIMPIVKVKNGVNIPHIKSYNSITDVQKKKKYLETATDYYTLLNKALGVG